MLMKFKQLGIVKGILSIVAVIGALVCIGYGVHYQFVYKQSPEYSLRILYKSIQDGDTDTFFAMVDGEGILHRVFDPYIEKLLKESDGRNISQTNSKGETKILNLGEALLFTAIDNYYLEEKNKKDGVVNIEIRALDTKTNETKVLPVEMTQMDNKMWRVTGYDYKTYSLPYDGFDRI